MRGAELYKAVCRAKILTFQLTVHVGLSKEGGRAKRIGNSELKVMVYPNIPFSVFCFYVAKGLCLEPNQITCE